MLKCRPIFHSSVLTYIVFQFLFSVCFQQFFYFLHVRDDGLMNVPVCSFLNLCFHILNTQPVTFSSIASNRRNILVINQKNDTTQTPALFLVKTITHRKICSWYQLLFYAILVVGILLEKIIYLNNINYNMNKRRSGCFETNKLCSKSYFSIYDTGTY